mmetsp:Transcript_79039/g.124776  ORF Transcript_79039/g.124776 Transcript_79039/m.124776 type:complete len:108 (-) Transcript_79039:20-343(-)
MRQLACFLAMVRSSCHSSKRAAVFSEERFVTCFLFFCFVQSRSPRTLNSDGKKRLPFVEASNCIYRRVCFYFFTRARLFQSMAITSTHYQQRVRWPPLSAVFKINES